MNKKEIEKIIKSLFKEWTRKRNKEISKLDKIRYSGPLYDEDEYENMLNSIFSDWWSGGHHTIEAEKKLSLMSNRNFSLLTNSGSSANLILMSGAKELFFEDGDKIATLSCGFPTTINPIIHNRLIPVFLDIDLEQLNLNPELLEDCLKKDPKVKGLFIAHTLGFKNRIDEILDLSRKYNIQIFFDNCDSYGTKYKGKPIQSFGKIVSYSFYAAHHLSCGEGGGISTNDGELNLIMRGFRGWGRYCPSSVCCIRSKRPELFCPEARLTKDSNVPSDYNTNYQYEWLGYNLKILDLQAAILEKQLDKLEKFNKIRKRNYKLFYDYFKNSKYDFKIWEIDDEVSPFAFPIIFPENVKFNRKHLMDHFKRNKVETRLLFGGNLTKHPAYVNNSSYWKIHGDQKNSDIIMNRALMLGVSQINSKKNIERTINIIDDFLKKF